MAIEVVLPRLNSYKNTLISIIRWVFGAFFLIMCLGAFLEHSYFAVLLFLLAAIIAIPLTATELENRFNVKMSGTVRFLVLFVLLIVAAYALPASTHTAVNNSTEPIAASPSSVSGSDAIAVPSAPAQVATPAPNPEVTPTPEATPTPTPEATPTATSAPTPDKGTLDILTSPAGATITVDGVSRGLSPVNAVLHQLDQKIIYPHYDFKHLTEKYFEIGMKLNDFSIQLVKY